MKLLRAHGGYMISRLGVAALLMIIVGKTNVVVAAIAITSAYIGVGVSGVLTGSSYGLNEEEAYQRHMTRSTRQIAFGIIVAVLCAVGAMFFL